MTTPADDAAVEEAFEAYLAGRRVPGPEVRLVSFAGAVRASATEPGRPNAALAELLATGLLADQPGRAVSRPARRSRRRRTRMLATALFAKIASAGLAAKAATAGGLVVVGLTTAGFTGNLGPVQHPFATLVDHATPFTAPDPAATPSADVTAPVVDDPTPTATETPAATSTAATSTAAPTGSDESTAPERSGAVTAPAHPSNYGGQVSSWAHDKNSERKAGVTSVPAKPTKSASHGSDASQGSHGSDGSVGPDRSDG